jgi:hypothetical protein
MHPRGGKEYGRIIFRNQGLTLNPGVTFKFKEFNKFETEFIGSHGNTVPELGVPVKRRRATLREQQKMKAES